MGECSFNSYKGRNVNVSGRNDQCDQIGRFLKVFGNEFAYKRSLKILLTFGLIWKWSINGKMLSIFLGHLWKHLGNFFTSTSGHTEISQYPSNTSFSSWQRETECTAVFISLQLLLKLGQLRPLFSFTFNFRFFLKSVTNASVNEFMKTV